MESQTRRSVWIVLDPASTARLRIPDGCGKNSASTHTHTHTHPRKETFALFVASLETPFLYEKIERRKDRKATPNISHISITLGPIGLDPQLGLWCERVGGRGLHRDAVTLAADAY
ncbi:hypothetical protein RRG08_043392 [Elysia crispata]|uniref:Uncharacterized protein n=1 Tax=Elysia crispata TaxID=231223 RepID=A0AAE1AU07_9GAST|nr:hypothetical protein RRG08_043392 [Elysia crispata]